MTTEFRITYRVGAAKMAAWYTGENVNEATAKLVAGLGGVGSSQVSIVSVSKRCGAPNRYKRAGAWVHGECQRLTSDERCHLHRDR